MATVYQPFIVVPPFTSCTQSYILFGQGTAPYTIFPISTGSANGSALEVIPTQYKAGVFSWTVDFQPGANITWVLVDSTGAQAYSEFRVVQPGITSSCPKNTYKGPHQSLGAILGAVLGTLAVVAFLLTAYFCCRRKDRLASRSRVAFMDAFTRSQQREAEQEAAALERNNGVRTGTFNLNVPLNEANVDHMKMLESPPPTYSPSRGILGRLANRMSNSTVTVDRVPVLDSSSVPADEHESRETSPATATIVAPP